MAINLNNLCQSFAMQIVQKLKRKVALVNWKLNLTSDGRSCTLHKFALIFVLNQEIIFKVKSPN
jgi:hypothetical protein